MKRLAALLSVAVCGSSLAQNIVQPFETLPSFKSNQVFHVGPIDDVSLFSGDPQITVPLGPEFTLSPGVKWQLSAHYSAKMWHMWSQFCNSGGCDGYLSRARLGGNSALGAGWTIELGHVIAGSTFPGEDPRPRYKSSTGSIAYLSMPQTGYGFPDDNSFVRFSSAPFWTMQRPDGTTWEFTHQFLAPASQNSYDFCDDDRLNSGLQRYGLEHVKDRFGDTVLTVTYDQFKPWQVKTVTLGNGQVLTFTWDTFQRQGGSPVWDILKTIAFSSVGGNGLTIGFQRVGAIVSRTSFQSGTSNQCPLDPAWSTIDAPLLSRIDVGGHHYDFTYAGGALTTDNQTLISSYTLPTGGRVEFDWNSYTVLQPCVEGSTCNPEVTTSAFGAGQNDVGDTCASWRTHLQNFIDVSPGVVTRREVDSAGAATTQTTYARNQFGGRADLSGNGTFDPSLIVRQVLVTRPDGNGSLLSTKHVFNKDGAELERRSYNNASAVEPPVRTQIFCYDSTLGPTTPVCGVLDPTHSPSQFVEVWSVIPFQQSRELTWYGANPQPGGHCTDAPGTACRFISRTNWDPNAREYGTEAAGVEYVTSTTSASMVQSNFLRRETLTHWTPAAVTTAWMPKVFDSRTVQDVYCQQAPCNNVVYGYCPPEVAPCDQTRTYTNLSNGNLGGQAVSDNRTGFVGGVSASYIFTNNDPTTETATGSGSVVGSVITTRQYQTTTQSLHAMLNAKRATFNFYSFDVDREAQTGLITRSRDSNNTLVTNYSYDNLGRLKTIEPPGVLRTAICYNDAAGSAPAYAIVRRTSSTLEADWCNPSVVAPAEGAPPVEVYAYDGFGRSIREIRKLPNTLAGGGLAFKATIYNEAGYVQSETEWQPCQSNSISACLTVAAAGGQRTAYSNFDFLGRWRHRVGPDGSVVDRSFDDPAPIYNSDTAELVTLREINAAPGTGQGSLAYSCKRSDIFKRTFVTSIPGNDLFQPPPPGFNFRCGPLTTHTWNVLDKVARTNQIKPDSTFQVREFNYDKLGNLRSEKHPESGVATYSSFDVLGNVLSRTEADGRNVTTTYDALGRLLTLNASSVNYRTNYYDGNGFAGGTYKLGRLTRQVSSNPGSTLENAVVEEDYAYDGLGGRLSARTTRLKRASGTTLLEPSQTYVWNNLGLLQTHGHARVSGTFSTDTFYTSGVPTRLTAGAQTIVSQALYNAAGGLQYYTTGDAVQTAFTPDGNGLARPIGISTAGMVPASANFNTGTISYDGVGNIRLMRLSSGATDSFTYDLAGRLTQATWGTLGVGVQDQFTYDGTSSALSPLGNLTEKRTDGAVTSLAVNTSTNQLSAGTYGPAGELRTFGTKTYTFDGLLRQVRFSQTGSTEHSIFGADDERIVRVIPSAAVAETSKSSRLFTLNPCRLFDSRQTAPLTPAIERTVQATGVCGVPSNATALAANVTSISATENGNIRAYASGISFRPLMTANGVRAGYSRGVMNMIELGDPAGSEPGKFRLLSDMPTTAIHVTVDVNGYFAPVSTTTGNSWYVTLRDDEHRLSTEYRWDEATATLNLLSDHIYLGSIRVATLGSSATESVPLGLTFYSTDHLGTPRLAHTTGGTLVASYRYRAFGEPYTGTSQTPGTTTTQGLGFALMERDAISGDHYDHARFYSGYTGRFNRPDVIRGRIEDPPTWNRYAYAKNNPLAYADPDGKDARDVLDGFKNALLTDQVGGLGRSTYSHPDFQIGQALGDAAAAIGGAIEAAAGIGFIASGGALEIATVGVATPVAVPAAGVGVAALAHGGVQGLSGLTHLAQGMHGHHTDPKALGGHPDQPLAEILAGEHVGRGGVHSDLARFEGGWLRPRMGMTGQDIIKKFGRDEIISGLRRFYSQDKWKHLLPTFEEAVKYAK